MHGKAGAGARIHRAHVRARGDHRLPRLDRGGAGIERRARPPWAGNLITTGPVPRLRAARSAAVARRLRAAIARLSILLGPLHPPEMPPKPQPLGLAV